MGGKLYNYSAAVKTHRQGNTPAANRGPRARPDRIFRLFHPVMTVCPPATPRPPPGPPRPPARPPGSLPPTPNTKAPRRL